MNMKMTGVRMRIINSITRVENWDIEFQDSDCMLHGEKKLCRGRCSSAVQLATVHWPKGEAASGEPSGLAAAAFKASAFGSDAAGGGFSG